MQYQNTRNILNNSLHKAGFFQHLAIAILLVFVQKQPKNWE